MIQIERLRFEYMWSMMTRSRHKFWHVRTNKCVLTNICKTSVFVFSVRNVNNCGRILTQFTGLLRANTVAAKRNLLTERTCLGKSESVALCKNRTYHRVFRYVEEGQISGFDPLPRKIRCRSAGMKAQILKMLTSLHTIIFIPDSDLLFPYS